MDTQIYIARLSCGCVIDLCPVSDDDTLWLHSVRGNGWDIEIVDGTSSIQFDCDDLASVRPLKTMNMFGDVS